MTTTVTRSTKLIPSVVPSPVRVCAHQYYVFQSLIAYSTDWEAGFRYEFVTPPGAVLQTKWLPASAARQELSVYPDYRAIAVDPLSHGLLMFREFGLLSVGATAGVVEFHFAQDSPHHTLTVVHARSYLWLSEVPPPPEVNHYDGSSTAH